MHGNNVIWLFASHLIFSALQTTLVEALPAQTILDSNALNPYPSKPKITFREDGSFKLMVISDLHFGEQPSEIWGPEQDSNSTRLLRNVLKEEAPDYIVINGDLITGDDTFRENSTLLVDQVVAPLNEVGIPFSSVHGNHDNHVNITHLDEIKREQLVGVNSYTRPAPPGVGGTGGEGNYWVPVYKHSNDRQPSLILWFFDSRGGISTGPNPHALEDWVDASVAEWIQVETEKMEQAWGPSKHRGALAFVHIPPYFVRNLQANLNSTVSPGLNADHMGEGSSQQQGKDEAFWKALTTHVPNLHALISGHDHGNEWCARERKTDVIFCFAKHSGYGGYGAPEWGFGIRNIVFTGYDTIGTIKTWVRMEDGEKKALLDLDASFDPSS